MSSGRSRYPRRGPIGSSDAQQFWNVRDRIRQRDRVWTPPNGARRSSACIFPASGRRQCLRGG
eukprot:9937449-Lingulodinium_polyedra.AAC.1